MERKQIGNEAEAHATRMTSWGVSCATIALGGYALFRRGVAAIDDDADREAIILQHRCLEKCDRETETKHHSRRSCWTARSSLGV